jgi:hypothetical protein
MKHVNLRNSVIAAAVIVCILFITTMVADEHLKQLNQKADEQFAKVETAHQRQADLIPAFLKIIRTQPLHPQSKTALAEIQKFFDEHGKRVHLENWDQLPQFETDLAEINNDLMRLQMLADSYAKLKTDKNLNQLKVLHQDIKRQISADRGEMVKLNDQYNSELRSFPYLLAKLFMGRQARPPFRP